MRKIISVLLIMIMVLGFSGVGFTESMWSLATIKVVGYDEDYQAYYIYIEDQIGEGWVINIVEDVEFNQQLLNKLKSMYEDNQIAYKWDDMNTLEDIYDDIILEYIILK